MATRVFTSFDYDHDEKLRVMLVGQSKHEDTPFEICNWSVKEPFSGDWKKKVRERLVESLKRTPKPAPRLLPAQRTRWAKQKKSS